MMATITDADFVEIRDVVAADPVIKGVFKSWGLDKDTWKGLFQAAEDWFTNGFNSTPTTSFKGALDAVATTTATQAKWVGKVWFVWRIGINW